MTPFFTIIGAIVALFVLQYVFRLAFCPKTSVEELLHLLSSDEDALIDSDLQIEQVGGTRTFSRLVLAGDKVIVSCGIQDVEGVLFETVTVFSIATKAMLIVKFKNRKADGYHYRPKLFSTTTKYKAYELDEDHLQFIVHQARTSVLRAIGAHAGYTQIA